ncbi:hypothetical protein LLE49_19480 [Alicyclobacillus tolerans]|uniref:DUF6582 domain-containing protein n=1 Tax=Alicyclobacillus tolerans TaxID=90970 RepID=UPI001F2CBF66|nr:DUF6582 domain-containing protein [Alicyclobacillus tolerans]MCF8566904.1 hypothetical protein [Alicyclobacillus tolerans]
MLVFADALTKEQRDKLKDSDFAVPGKRELPIHNKTHIKLAWDMVDRTKDLTAEERKEARKNILAAAKKMGMDTSDWDKSAMTDSVFSRPEVILDSQAEGQKEKLPPGILMRVRHRGTRADVVNGNNRVYPRQVLTDAIDRAKKNYLPITDQTRSKMIMESPHPEHFKDAQGNIHFKTSLDNKVARIVDVWMDEQGWVWFDSDIFDTTKGRNIAALIRAGEEVGVSIRSVGNSVRKVINDSYAAVATFMDLQTWDYVDDPATDGSGTDSVVLTDSQLQVITDGLAFSDPICPIDGTMLQPFDPDKDNDVDFWACPKCKSRYDVYNGVQVNVSGNQTLYRRYDSPEYGADRAGANPPAVSDPGAPGSTLIVTTDSRTSNPEGANNVNLTPEQIQAMIQQATAPFQTMLDAQHHAEETAQKRAEAQAFLDSKFEDIKSKYSAPVLEAIKKAVGQPQTKEQAEIVLDSVLDMAGQVSANEFLQALGFSAAQSPAGQTRVTVTNEPKPWQSMVDSMLSEMDRIDTEKGTKHDPELRKLNKVIIDKILDKFETKDHSYQAMKDSAETVQALLDSGASVTTAQLLNQPTIQEVILIQKFQDLEATQFMMTDVFEGSEWRIPSESFSGQAAIDPNTLIYDLTVAENSAIPEAQVDVIWASFSPQARRNAISLTTDVIRAMGTGPLKYNAPARAIYHIGKQAARHIDSYSYWDMATTADEYNPLVVANESVTVTAVNNGTNVAYKGQLQLGGKAGQADTTYGTNFTFAPAGSTPIVRPRKKQSITANGSVQTTTTNSITCTVGGTTLTIGGLDSNGNIVGTGAQFAINFETGDIYFIAGLGIVTGATPVYPVISYSASTNYDLWHYTMGTGYTREEDWYNTLLMQLSATNAIMGSSPRYNPANLALFSLNNSNYVRNAQIFYKLAQPAGVSLTPTRNFFGTRDELDLYKLNAPWVLGDSRILLTQKNATRYGIQTPYKIEGPIQKQDPTTGNLLPVKAWYGEEFSAIVTPQVLDKNGNVLNPVSRTIRIVS